MRIKPVIRKQQLEKLYRKYNRRKYVSPDPLQFLYDYTRVGDREIVALVASSLAYGRVAQILKSVDNVLGRMGKSPREFIIKTPEKLLKKIFSDFKHRFTTGAELACMLKDAGRIVQEHGSLNEYFLAGMRSSDKTVLPAIEAFVAGFHCKNGHLAPVSARGSACKRLNLFLRWMVRKDAVDPGGWHGVPRDKLIVPLDTHMVKIGKALGFTKRKSPGMAMALEITTGFCRLVPEDPVKYDFALTRLGIREDLSIREGLADIGVKKLCGDC